MSFFVDFLAGAYVLVVELAPAPQIVKLHLIKRADQISLSFTALLAIGRLAIPYAIRKGAHILAWGLLAGAAIRVILFLQAWRLQRRHATLKQLRDEQ